MRSLFVALAPLLLATVAAEPVPGVVDHGWAAGADRRGRSTLKLFEPLTSGVWVLVHIDTVRSFAQQYRP